MALALAGCGGSGETTTSAGEGSVGTTAAKNIAEKKPYPVPAAAPGREPLEKLVVKDLERGDGPVGRWGDEVTVRYVGVYYETGKIYSQHWNFSLDFKLDNEQFGPGWQKGIEGMRVGGRREILIPSDQLFGDGDLAYIVTLLKVKPGRSDYAQNGPFAGITIKGQKKPRFEPSGRAAPEKLLSRELEAGYGPPAERGDEVSIRYAGAVYETGEVRYGGTTHPFELGAGGLGSAFERGIEGMRAEARRELIVPSRFLNNSGAVDYVIELTSLEPAPARQGGG